MRFRRVTDEHRLERQLGNIMVNGLKLYVNIPKYGRPMTTKAEYKKETKMQGDENKHETEAAQKRQPQPRIPLVSYAMMVATNTRNSGQIWTQQNVLYRPDESQSTVQLEIPKGEKNWCRDAWVGRLKNLAMFDRLEDEISWDVGANVSSKYQGDEMVLLLGLTDIRAEQLAQEDDLNGPSLFHSLEKWNSGMRTRHRLVWVQCWGIPLIAWNMAQIQKMVATIGDMVEVDDDAKESWRLDRARVLIRIPWRPTIQYTVNVHLSGEVYEVYIVEENGNSAVKCNCRFKGGLGSSEEIDSDDSDMGTLLSKLDGAPEIEVVPTWGNKLLTIGPNETARPLGNDRGQRPHCHIQQEPRAENLYGNEDEHAERSTVAAEVSSRVDVSCRAQNEHGARQRVDSNSTMFSPKRNR